MDFITPLCQIISCWTPQITHTTQVLVLFVALHQPQVHNTVFIIFTVKPPGICPFCTLPVNLLHEVHELRTSCIGSAEDLTLSHLR